MNFANRSGMFANNPGKSANRSGMFANKPGKSANRSGMFANKPGKSVNRSGMFANKPGKSANRSRIFANKLENQQIDPENCKQTPQTNRNPDSIPAKSAVKCKFRN
ncbi:hypothetical protein V7021_02435 [Cytobacillus firmus]